ncbi:MAG: phosphate/phosphite/phosphonate ABC transporter substrate-binding protein [Acidimicrobiales bacterium]
MRSSRNIMVRLMALLAAFMLVAAACGDDDDNGATSTDDNPTTTAAAGSADGGAGGDVDRSDWPDSLVFAAVPAEQDAQLRESYRVTVEILQDELGIDIEFFQAADYAGVVEALIANRVDMAQFGPFSYAIAIANGAEAEPAGVMVGAPDEEPGYVSYLVTRSDNDEIDSIDDIVGKRVCFVDPASTSGYLYPSAGVIAAGIDPESDITPIMAGGHDASVIAVVAGDCDAGFAFDSMVDTLLIDRGEIEDGDVKVVWESEVIAGSPLAVRTGLPDSLVAEIKRIINESVNVDWAVENGYCESQDDCSLNDEDVWGYVPRDDSFYDGVRAVCTSLGSDRAPQCEGIG